MNKRFLSVAASTAIVASAIVFTGCGSSSTSSTSTTSTSGGSTAGVFFKGVWSGISYNGTGGVSGTTNSTGHYSYNANGNTDFDLGLITLRTNSTALDNNGVVYAAQATNVATGSTVTSTEIGNLLGVLSAFGINETQTNTTNAANLSTLLTKLKALKAQDATTYNASSSAMDVNTVTNGLAAAAGVANKTVALQATTAYNAYSAAAANKMQAVGSSVASLNTSFLQNKAIFLTDGTILAFNGSTLTGASMANQAGTIRDGGYSTNATVVGLNSSWAASGAFINMTGANGLSTMSLAGPLAAGTKVVTTNETGTMFSKEIAAVGYNLVGGIGQGNGSTTTTSKTYVLNSKNVEFGNNASTTQGFVKVNGVQSGNWSLPTVYFGYAVNVTNATGNGTNMTVTFDNNPDSTTYTVVAKWWNAAVATVAALVAQVLNLFA